MLRFALHVTIVCGLLVSQTTATSCGSFSLDATNADDVIASISTCVFSIVDSLTIHGPTSLTHFVMPPGISAIGGDVIVGDTTDLISVDFNNVASFGGDVKVTNNSALTTVDLAAAVTVSGTFELYNNFLVDTVLLNSLATVEEAFNITENAALTQLLLPSIVALDGDVSIVDNAALVALNGSAFLAVFCNTENTECTVRIDRNAELVSLTLFKPFLISPLEPFSESRVLHLHVNSNLKLPSLEPFSYFDGHVGTLELSYLSIQDLTPLSSLDSVGESLTIKNMQQLSSLAGLSTLLVTSSLKTLELEDLPLIFSLASFLTVATGPENANDLHISISALAGLTSSSALDDLDNLFNIVKRIELNDIPVFPLEMGTFTLNPGEVELRNIDTTSVGFVSVRFPSLTELIIAQCDLLSNLTTWTSSSVTQLTLANNALLTSLEGLSFPGNTAQRILIKNNPVLTNLDALLSVTVIEEALEIDGNLQLTSLQGLSSVTRVGTLPGEGDAGVGTLYIANNDALLDVNMTSLQHVGSDGSSNYGTLFLSNNNLLPSLAGLSGFNGIIGTLIIDNNDKLASLHGLHNVADVRELLNITNNSLLDMPPASCALPLSGASTLKDLYVVNNPSLVVMRCFNAYTSIDNVNVVDNAALTTIISFNNVPSMNHLQVKGNPELTTFDAILSTGSLLTLDSLILIDNPKLTSLTFFSSITDLGETGSSQEYSLYLEGLDLIEDLSFLSTVQVFNDGNIFLRTMNIQSLFANLTYPPTLTNVGIAAQHCPLLERLDLPPTTATLRHLQLQHLDSFVEIPALAGPTPFIFGDVEFRNLAVWNPTVYAHTPISVQGALEITSNPALWSLYFIRSFSDASSIVLQYNTGLVDISDLSSVISYNSLKLLDNPEILVATGLSPVPTKAFELEVQRNNKLTQLEGFNAAVEFSGVVIKDNALLNAIDIADSAPDFNSVTVTNLPNLESLVMFDAALNGSYIEVSSLAKLASMVAFPFLTSLAGNLQVSMLDVLPRFNSSFSRIKNVIGNIDLIDNSLLEAASFDDLETVGKLLRVKNCDAITAVAFPMLNEANLLVVSECNNLKKVELDSLPSVSSGLHMRDNPQFLSLTAPLLTSVGLGASTEFDGGSESCRDIIVSNLCAPSNAACTSCGGSSACKGGCPSNGCNLCQGTHGLWFVALPKLDKIVLPSLLTVSQLFFLDTGLLEPRGLEAVTTINGVFEVYDNQKMFTLAPLKGLVTVNELVVASNPDLCFNATRWAPISTDPPQVSDVIDANTNTVCLLEELSTANTQPGSEAEAETLVDLVLVAMGGEAGTWATDASHLEAGAVENNLIASLEGVTNYTKNEAEASGMVSTTLISSTGSAIKNIFLPASMTRMRSAGVSNRIPAVVASYAVAVAKTLPCGSNTTLSGSDVDVSAVRKFPSDLAGVFTSTGVQFQVPLNFTKTLNASTCQTVEFSTFVTDPYVPVQTQTIRSSVVVFSVDGTTVSNLTESEAFVFTLTHTSTGSTGDVYACVWWDRDTTLWTTSGCEVVASTTTSTTCRCNHLTSFAVLLDVNGSSQLAGLEVLTYVGCALSMIGAVIYILTFSILRSLATGPTYLVMNLCVAIFFTNLVFLVGIDRTSNASACTASAAFLYFFLMACFCWMLCLSYQLYGMLVQLNVSSGKASLKPYLLFGWGTPLALMVVLVIANAASGGAVELGNTTNCWIGSQGALIGAFLVPVLIVIVINMIVFGLAVRSMETNRRAQKGRSGPNASGNHRQTMIVYVSLLLTLGFTWLFGYLAIVSTAVFWYPFVIFNSAQGLLLCLVYCFRSRVRDAWRVYLGMDRSQPSKSDKSKGTKSTGVSTGTKNANGSSGGGGRSGVISGVMRSSTMGAGDSSSRAMSSVAVAIDGPDTPEAHRRNTEEIELDCLSDTHSGEHLLSEKTRGNNKNNDKYGFATTDVTESMMDEFEQHPELYGIATPADTVEDDQTFARDEPTWTTDEPSPFDADAQRGYIRTGDVTQSMVEDFNMNPSRYFDNGGESGRSSTGGVSVDMKSVGKGGTLKSHKGGKAKSKPATLSAATGERRQSLSGKSERSTAADELLFAGMADVRGAYNTREWANPIMGDGAGSASSVPAPPAIVTTVDSGSALASPPRPRQARLSATMDASPLMAAAHALGESVAAIMSPKVSPTTKRRPITSPPSSNSIK